MDFKTFLNETEYTASNESMLCEKVESETRDLLNPYTKRLCDYLAHHCRIDPQAATTKFTKFSDAVVDEMLNSPQIFKLFKRYALVNDYADPDDKSIKNKDGVLFIACANNGDNCKGLVVFKISKERYINILYDIGFDRFYGGEQKFNTVINALSNKGNVSIFAITTSQQDTAKLNKLLKDRKNLKNDPADFTKATVSKFDRRLDLDDFKGAKAVEKLASKLPDHVDALINNFGDDPATADYKGVLKNVRYISKILNKFTGLKRERSYRGLIDDVETMLQYSDDLKGNPLLYTDDNVNESVPNDVRKLFSLDDGKYDGIYRSLHRCGISAEHADYTILEDETKKFNTATAKGNFNWYRREGEGGEPVRITMIKKWLKKYDALILINPRQHAVITSNDSRRGFNIEGSDLLQDRVFAIVGVDGGSLKDVYAAKNIKRMRRRGKAYDIVVELLIALKDQLKSIDYKKEIFYNKHTGIDNALEICRNIIDTCKDVVEINR